jgi:hypothetical protein
MVITICLVIAAICALWLNYKLSPSNSVVRGFLHILGYRYITTMGDGEFRLGPTKIVGVHPFTKDLSAYRTDFTQYFTLNQNLIRYYYEGGIRIADVYMSKSYPDLLCIGCQKFSPSAASVLKEWALNPHFPFTPLPQPKTPAQHS